MQLKELLLMQDLKIELDLTLTPERLWVANFSPMVEVAEDGVLIGTCGYGASIDKAIFEMCMKVSNKRIRISQPEGGEQRINLSFVNP